MGEQLLWWHHHHLVPPPRGRDSRLSVQRHAWGATVWEGPTRDAPGVPLRVVDVVVADPDAPARLAHEAALDALPRPSWDRRLARRLPDGASPLVVRVGATVLAILAVLAVVAPPLWLVLAACLLLPGVPFVDRLPSDPHATRARRAGLGTAPVGYSGRTQLADALCRRAAAGGLDHADHVVRAVRVALWDCRAGDPRSSGRLNRWLVDVDRADTLATGIGMFARSLADGDGPPTMAQRAAALAPALVETMTSASEHERREALAQLRGLRDACAEARAAREALESTVARSAATPELRAVADDASAASEAERELRRHRVGEVLGELHTEADILREVDAELRARDEDRRGPDTRPNGRRVPRAPYGA